jgi:hypothetical protein
VEEHDTAFRYREANGSKVIVGVDPDPANNDRIIGWTREYGSSLHPCSEGGAYVNFMMEEGQEPVQATYHDNYERLAPVKKQYDLQNLFRVNRTSSPRRDSTRADEDTAFVMFNPKEEHRKVYGQIARQRGG